MEVEGIEAILEAGKGLAEVFTHDIDGRKLVVAGGSVLREFEAIDPKLPMSIKQTVTLADQQSFNAYVNRFSQESSVVFATAGAGAMKAVLDYHAEKTPMHCRHVATFNTLFDPRWKRWQAIDRKPMTQIDFAYFIEENLDTIATPDGADLLTMAQNLKVNRSHVFASNTQLRNGTVQFELKESDSTEVKGVPVNVWENIGLFVPIYLNRGFQSVTAKLRYDVKKGEPVKFRIDVLNRDLIELEAFQTMCDEVAEATKLPVYLSA